MGVQIFFRILKVVFVDFVEPFFVEEEGALVVGGIFIHLRHRQRVDRTGFDAISAKDAFGDVDIEFAGKSLQRSFGILLAEDLDAT